MSKLDKNTSVRRQEDGQSSATTARGKSGGFWEAATTIVYAVLIAVGIRFVLIEPFNIPSGSMVPTLLEGDYLFVTKYSYGYSRHSFSLFGRSLPFDIGGEDDRVFGSQPERGDVAVFKLPRDNRTDYIKRVIGLPGDRVQVTGGILHVNGQAVERNAVGEYVEDMGNGVVRRAEQYVEVLPEGREHLIIEDNDRGLADNTGVYTVPEGHYFMMGDNRDHSLDSRVLNSVGFVPGENLVGRAEFIFFSANENRSQWWEVWNWPTAIRWDRILMSIE